MKPVQCHFLFVMDNSNAIYMNAPSSFLKRLDEARWLLEGVEQHYVPWTLTQLRTKF